MYSSNHGFVSVILVNYRGVDDTLAAVEHLKSLNWPAEKLEVVVVENASGDQSAQRLRDEAPDVVLVESKENLGFAGGCNLGVRHSHGEYLAFLNNDARPDDDWVTTAVSAFTASPRVGAVASRVLNWDGNRVDFMGAAMTWYGMGYKPWTGESIPRTEDRERDVLFGTGSAMFVRRAVFEELGGFDERYFMFFEDVDLGWRLNLLGWRFRYVPSSLAYHKHHASMRGYGAHKENYLLERNALFTLYKNADDDTLRESLPAAMALAVRRGIARSGADSAAFDLRRNGDDAPEMTISTNAVVPLFAIDQFTTALPGLSRDRERIQASRVISDAVVWRLFGQADAPVLQDDDYLEGYQALVTAFDVTERPPSTRVLIVTGDPVGPKLAGPGIRAWHMAGELAQQHDVKLVSLSGVIDTGATFDLVHVTPGDDRTFRPLEQWADVIIFQGHAMAVFDSLRNSSKVLVADIYDPMHLEQLEQGRELPPATWAKQVEDATEVLNQQLERADFLLCASERQRHFYLGQLAGLGRINPSTYAGDPNLAGLLAVVPFGLASTPPEHRRDVLKGVRPGIAADDKLLLWSGGLYNWFDPETLIRAVAHVAVDHPNVKLFFQGTKHPHPGVPEMEIVARSRAVASGLGILDTHVFFNDTWVEYNERQNFLTEADAGVSTHHAHVETTFSFRTRILDYLWAGLPMVVTEGDHFADLVKAEGLGVAVPAGDASALADALARVLFDEEFAAEARRNVARVRERYTWKRVLEPLTSFMLSPGPAADRQPAVGAPQARSRARRPRRRSGLRHDLRLAMHYLRNGGPSVVASKVAHRLRRRT